jgi:hypothetical protein
MFDTLHEHHSGPPSGRRGDVADAIATSLSPARLAADTKVRRWLRDQADRHGLGKTASALGMDYRKLQKWMKDGDRASIGFREILCLPREVARPLLLLALADMDQSAPPDGKPLLARLVGLVSLNNDLLAAWAAGSSGPLSPATARAMMAVCDRITDEVCRVRWQLAAVAKEAK